MSIAEYVLHGIDFQVSKDTWPALCEAEAQYFLAMTAKPFDQNAASSDFLEWKSAMEAVSPELAVSPKTVMYAPRPPGVTDEEIAEIGAALARGYWPVT